MRKKALTIAIYSILASATLGVQAASGYDESYTPASLEQLEHLDQATKDSEFVDGSAGTDIDQLRTKSLKEAAETLGMQSGVKYRYDLINKELDTQALELDRIYKFSGLMLHNGKMLPPVLLVTEGSQTLESPDLLNMSDITYNIHTDARLVNAPPSWRDYLYKKFATTDTVNKALLPKSPEEKLIWKVNVKKGWLDGVKHAEYMFGTNISKLTRDYLGMTRFLSLSKQHIVSVPMLSEGDFAVNINGKTMDVGQRIFRITNPAAFNAEGWIPLGAKE